ncbi:MAG TPA: phospho-sugar mutase [Mycobacteriales bacterium]
MTDPAATELRARARRWLADDPDPRTRAELAELLAADDLDALGDRFADRLHFGTAGLRGPMRAGPAGMNRAVVRRTAAGLAAYLRRRSATGPVVIGYDARHGSADFARDSAAVLAGAGLDARLLPRALPTPVLAFAVRALSASAGVMVTASHNPAQDNGYKVYLGGDLADGPAGDGAQIVPPADAEIEAEILAVDGLDGVPLSEDWIALGDEVVDAYLTEIARVPRTAARDVSIVFTPLHGVGGDVTLEALRRTGFPAPMVVVEEAQPDPDFPSMPFPNPEEPGVLDRALRLAADSGADLVIANDPDADRCAVALGGRVLAGDELGVLLADHLMRTGEHGRFATTIVSSSMLAAMCADRGVPYAESLTGFKWIVRTGEDLVYGYEEALGYAVAPDVVRDKDGISAALLIADLAASLRAEGRSLQDRLDELAVRHGVHATGQLSIRVEDLSLISRMMRRLRAAPPTTLLDRPVTDVQDRLPEADVVTLHADGCRVVVRPSGTEPKLKAYLQVVVGVAADGLVSARETAGRLLAALHAEISELLAED